MGQITLEIPDGFYTLDPQKRAEVEAQIQHLLQQAIESTSEPADAWNGTLMDLAGAMKSSQPRLSDAEEKAVVAKHIARRASGDRDRE